MTADLSALIASLEAAEVGSRELDGEIEEIFDLWRASFTEPEKADGRHCWTDLATWSGEGVVHSAPPYTTSLDAALALAKRVLERWAWEIRIDESGAFVQAAPVWWMEGLAAPDEGGVACEAATPALALCVAILRAKHGDKT